jgi:hypothetical protein
MFMDWYAAWNRCLPRKQKGEGDMLKRTRWSLGVAGAAVLALGLGVTGVRGLEHVVFVQPESTPAWVQRIALVDDAIERSEVSRAVYEWREAYGAAVRTKGSEALIAVAERAIRIAEHSGGGSGYFVNEARYIYLHAVGRARAERSRETILKIAEAFDRIGDAERASQVRRIAEKQS